LKGLGGESLSLQNRSKPEELLLRMDAIFRALAAKTVSDQDLGSDVLHDLSQ